MSSDELGSRRRLGIELDNLRAAVGWAFDAVSVDDVEIGVRVIDSLIGEAVWQPSWGIQTWAAPVLGRVDELAAEYRGAVHAAACYDAQMGGDLGLGVALGRRALADLGSFTPAYSVAMTLVACAEVHVDPVAAKAVLDEGWRVRRSPSPYDLWLHNAASYVAGIAGDRDTARRESELAVALARRLAIPTGLADSLTFLGHVVCGDDPDGCCPPRWMSMAAT